MRHQIITISQAKAKLLELSRQLDEEGRAYVLTRDGAPVGALIPILEYEALLETSDVLSNPETVASLKRALADEHAGRVWKRDAKGQWIKAKRKKSG